MAVPTESRARSAARGGTATPPGRGCARSCGSGSPAQLPWPPGFVGRAPAVPAGGRAGALASALPTRRGRVGQARARYRALLETKRRHSALQVSGCPGPFFCRNLHRDGNSVSGQQHLQELPGAEVVTPPPPTLQGSGPPRRALCMALAKSSWLDCDQLGIRYYPLVSCFCSFTHHLHQQIFVCIIKAQASARFADNSRAEDASLSWRSYLK
ncbi:uncharacterized protein [Oryctolagus cuniculus]|uniref:uncharacterized protein n=1 Tax=Oryctolagus cuniculus TaxID=9986 RepID=UPI003879EA1A